MQVGYNHNIKHKGKEYHIQTEDSGKSTMTITTLLYSEGSIVASKKSNYSKVAAEYENYTEQLKELMQKQHKQMLIDLKNGNFDDPELDDVKEPNDVLDAEDKTIMDAIEATGEKDSEGGVPEPPAKEEAPKEEAATKEESHKGEEIDKNVSEFVDEIFNDLTNTLLSLTQKNVEINKDKEELIDLEELSSRFDDNITIVKTKISKGLSAECAVIMGTKPISVVSDFVLMEEGREKEELSEDDVDAIKETFNQTFGSSVQQILNLFNLNVSFDSVNIIIINAAEKKDELKKLFTEKNVYAFTYDIKIEEKLSSKLYFYLSSNIKDRLKHAEPASRQEAEKTNILKDQDTEVVKAEDKLEQFEGTVFSADGEEERELRNVELIKGIEVDVKIKLGETLMPLKKISKLLPGTIIELNKDVDSILELVVNNKTIAEGVLVVVPSNNFALRITNILDKASRIKKLGGNK